MIRSKKNYVCGAALAALILTAHQSMFADCASGTGATLNQIATQNFAGSPPEDFITYSSAGREGSNFSLTPISNIVVDPATGAVRLLMQSTIFTPKVIQSTLAGAPNLELFPLSFANTPTQLFVAGTVWALAADGRVYNINAPNAGQGNGFSPQATLTGAAFDGTYAWFGTSNGGLRKIQLPSLTSPGVDDGIVFPFGNQASAIGPMSFDGRFLWIAQGSALSVFDPTTNQIVSHWQLGGVVSSFSFDGIYMWVGNSAKADMFKIDVQKLTVVNDITPGGGGYQNVVFDGSVVSAYSNTSDQVTRVRACDNSILHSSAALPSTPSNAVFDGNYHWITYTGTNMLSVR